MPTGVTTSSALTESFPTVIDSARVYREYPFPAVKLCEMHKLTMNTGNSWEEIELDKFSAQAITETTILDNPQQYVDTLRTVTPTQVGITTIVTKKTMNRISKNVAAMMGQQLQQAIERMKDSDVLTTIDGATNSQPGAGNTLQSGVVSAAVSNITGNTTEGADGPIATLLHPFQIKDIQDEITSGVGTYPVPQGMTADFFRKGWSGSLYNTDVYIDGNIAIDSASDSKGGVFAKKGLLYVAGTEIRRFTKELPERGGGADQIFIYDDYAVAERRPFGTSAWVWEIYSDTTAPTS